MRLGKLGMRLLSINHHYMFTYSTSTESIPDLFRYAQSSVFTVKFLGHLGNEQGQRGAELRHSEVLETIDAAQVRNTPPFFPKLCR